MRPTSYVDFYRMLMALRRTLAAKQLRPGSVAVMRIGFLPVAWIADLALRTLGVTTLCLRTDAELAACAELGIGCLLTFGAEPGGPLDPGVAPDAQIIVLSEADWQPG